MKVKTFTKNGPFSARLIRRLCAQKDSETPAILLHSEILWLVLGFELKVSLNFDVGFVGV
jgi:hypothetical protein